jgi:hypothetical protein
MPESMLLMDLFLIDDTKDADATNTHDTTQTVERQKLKLVKTSDAFAKVKEYLDKGGSLEEVKKKYEISKQVEQLLIN